jgi:hypothetical protein
VFVTEDDKLAAKENACCLCHRPVCRSSAERSCRRKAPTTPLLRLESQDDGVCLRCRQLLIAYTQHQQHVE